jgi:methyl-accepting chemotaxis protein
MAHDGTRVLDEQAAVMRRLADAMLRVREMSVAGATSVEHASAAVTQQVAAVEALASTASEMAALATRMRGSVQQFRTN